MSDLIEEAAKAICCQGGECMNANSTYFGCNSKFFVKEARAVFSRLDALGYAVAPKEPTPEMIAQGWDTIRRKQPMGPVFGSPGPALKEAYRAMFPAKPK